MPSSDGLIVVEAAPREVVLLALGLLRTGTDFTPFKRTSKIRPSRMGVVGFEYRLSWVGTEVVEYRALRAIYNTRANYQVLPREGWATNVAFALL